MIVTDIKLKQGKTCELNAKVETKSEEFSKLFYRLPNEFTQSIHVSADPFIAALLIISMRLDETLTVDAPASPRLLRSLPKIMAYYHNWDPKYKIIEVRTSNERQENDSISKANALFFSGGVDSFYALTRLTEQTADRNRLSHLIFVHGFDIKLNDNMLFEKSYAAVKDIASYYGKKLVLVSTNVREITDKYVSWINCYGFAMASVALCGLFRNVYIASELGPNEGYLSLAASSHPDLDPLWSTDTTALIHYGDGISRVEKAKALANNPMAQKHLRVCMENRNGAYNCGKCEKCVRTMLALYLAGALSNFNFPTKLTPELVKAINHRNSFQILQSEEILHELQRKGEDQLANALSQALNKNRSHEMEKEIDALRSELMDIKNCVGYKFMRFYGSIIDQALPNGTKRGVLKRRVLHRLRGSW